MNIKENATGIQHIGIPTNDIAETVKFYKALGFETAFETVNNGEKVAFLKLGNLVVETYENHAAAMLSGAVDHVAVDVKDIDEAYKFITENKMNNINDEIHFLPFWDNGVKFFKIKGINGEMIEFSQML